MRTVYYITDQLVEAFHTETILRLDTIKRILGTSSKATVFRKLKPLGYRASYSHAGKYYTLDEIAHYDKNGLWSFNRIHFSKYGSLITTLEHLIGISGEGYFASELYVLLQVRVHNALARLYTQRRVDRQQIGDEYLYISNITGELQLEKRKQSLKEAVLKADRIPVAAFASPRLWDCFKTLLSILNEKQKRLYLGLESMKLGHGGDVLMAQLSGINVKTIARGRRELESKDITPGRIRQLGGGRPPIKKN